jgi:hypothetical protein
LCPLATALLPGDPMSTPELLTGMTLPAASPHLLEAAYWVRLTEKDSVTRNEREKIAEGDYLLVETAERWTRRPEAYLGRLLVLRAPGRQAPLLARVSLNPEPFEDDTLHELNTFGIVNDACLVPRVTRQEARPSPGRTATWANRFYADDVAGVVLQIARLLGSGR